MPDSEPVLIQKEIDDAIAREFEKMLEEHKSNKLLQLLISTHTKGKRISDLPVEEIKEYIEA